METEGSLPRSHQPTTGPILSQMAPVRTFHTVSLRSILYNIDTLIYA